MTKSNNSRPTKALQPTVIPFCIRKYGGINLNKLIWNRNLKLVYNSVFFKKENRITGISRISFELKWCLTLSQAI